MEKWFNKTFKTATRRQQLAVIAGLVGTTAVVTTFVSEPSFPTPDKIFVFAICVGLIFRQAIQVVLRLGPFVALLLVYESFRGIAPSLNTRVNFTFMADFDKYLFGGTLPTKTLQNWWWDGHVKWYDYVFYLPYMLHFVLPFTLAIIVWKTREAEYWRYITAFIGISFVAFIFFVIFPAAPPWMASDKGVIEPIARVSSSVWATLGIHDFPSVYNKVTPNPVAAVPSLHAGYSTLFALFVISFWRSRWRWLVVVYPLLIYTGTIYQGEHYFFDELVGALLGVAGFYASPAISRKLVYGYQHIEKLLHTQYRKYAR